MTFYQPQGAHRGDTPYLILYAIVLFSHVGCGEQTSQTPTREAVLEDAPRIEQQFAAELQKAEAGDTEAQARVGSFYDQGEGVPKDAAKAVEWYQKAAEKGHVIAQFNLGHLYANGNGVAKDINKAISWWQQAASQNYPDAQYILGSEYFNGNHVPKDVGKAIEWMQKAAENKFPAAQFQLGSFFLRGEIVQKDIVKAIEWILKAAELGDANAQFTIGSIYSQGEGVPKDIAKAIEWWKKAAIQGHAPSMTNLGWAYAAGEGVATDRVLAYAWANLGASKGNPMGTENRNLYESLLTPAERAEAQRLSSNWIMGELISREGKHTSAISGNSPSLGALRKQGTATAFFVSKAGQAITNHHVVDDCQEIRIEGHDGVVKVSISDRVNDVALLQTTGAVDAIATITSAPAKLRQGEEIAVFGYPLNSVLSSGGNLTPGVVSALTGLGNNTNQIQITAPIQHGSSGSPVMNKKGEIVAMVSMKLSDIKMAKATGSVGQNVNFAVSGQTLKTFLDTHKVSYQRGGFISFEKSSADLADVAKTWTRVIECWR